MGVDFYAWSSVVVQPVPAELRWSPAGADEIRKSLGRRGYFRPLVAFDEHFNPVDEGAVVAEEKINAAFSNVVAISWGTYQVYCSTPASATASVSCGYDTYGTYVKVMENKLGAKKLWSALPWCEGVVNAAECRQMLWDLEWIDYSSAGRDLFAGLPDHFPKLHGDIKALLRVASDSGVVNVR